MFNKNSHISPEGLYFKGILQDIKKSNIVFQPIYESFTNSLESIKIRGREDEFVGKIKIEIRVTERTDGSMSFSSLSVIDNGIGFNDTEFRRFNIFKDYTKGFKNLGSGRIQYVQFFRSTEIKSIFKRDNKFFKREFSVSKEASFLNKNSIVFHKETNEIDSEEPETRLTFAGILHGSHSYDALSDEILKKALLKRYLPYFCFNRGNLPEIEIEFFVQGESQSISNISIDEIPQIDKSDEFEIPFSQLSSNGRELVKLERGALLILNSFKIPKGSLPANELNLVSKGEVVEQTNIDLLSLAPSDEIDGDRLLFMLSGDYLDSRDTNLRGELNIPTKNQIANNSNIFENEEILLEDIEDEVNSRILDMYPEIVALKEEHENELHELSDMFFLDKDIAQELRISINDSPKRILEKFYESEAKKNANIDAEIKKSFDNLEELDTRSPNYEEDLEREIEKLSKVIPQQNKDSLTHYVARRKLILELFDKILDRRLKVQQTGGNYDEALLHNVLFQQGSSDPGQSDLWIINEDFIYFRGSSERRLNKLELGGKLVFKEEFTEQEEKYLTSLGENRKIKRPDVLLFPEEGKCIILEFKSPEVNVADHLTQIDLYANLIRNYTRDDLQITTFYGYLIGQSIEKRDVLGRVSRYEHSYQFDYLYRPSEKVIGFDGRSDGSIYNEVIKYSTLLDRAKQRNRVFIEKLGKY